ncbi:MAG: hypothetical protein H7Z74_08230 [Anaerolineae bacterium]|nr:hypothetical protein [Gemmatimonadaceae bacterium]
MPTVSQTSSLLALAACTALAPGLALAQRGARAVSLAIQPRAGDTIRTRIDQRMQVTVTRRVGNSDTSLTMTSSMMVLARNVVQSVDDSGATVLVITDSVVVSESGGAGMPVPEELRRALQGKRMRVRMTREGATRLLDSPDQLAQGAQTFMAQMPAMLPGHPVAPGDTWSHAMTIPITGQPEAGGTGTVHTVFRLDSLTSSGERAFISMRGTVDRDSSAAEMAEGVKRTSTGSVTGGLQFDRKRGWLNDAETTIVVKSVLHKASDQDQPPMRFQIRVTQRMRTTKKLR